MFNSPTAYKRFLAAAKSKSLDKIAKVATELKHQVDDCWTEALFEAIDNGKVKDIETLLKVVDKIALNKLSRQPLFKKSVKVKAANHLLYQPFKEMDVFEYALSLENLDTSVLLTLLRMDALNEVFTVKHMAQMVAKYASTSEPIILKEIYKSRCKILQDPSRNQVLNWLNQLGSPKNSVLKTFSKIGKDKEPDYSIFLAWACHENADIASLLKHDLIADCAHHHHNFALLHAVGAGALLNVQHLLKIDAVRDSAHLNQNIILDLAVEKGEADIVYELIMLPKVYEGTSPSERFRLLELAAQKGHYHLAKLLLKDRKIQEMVAERGDGLLNILVRESVDDAKLQENTKIIESIFHLKNTKEKLMPIYPATMLKMLIKVGNTKLFKSLLEQNSQLLEKFIENGKNILDSMWMLNPDEKAKLLNSDIVRFNAPTAELVKVFNEAIKEGRYHDAKKMFEVEGVRQKLATAELHKLLVHAATEGDVKLLKEMLKLGQVKQNAHLGRNEALKVSKNDEVKRELRKLPNVVTEEHKIERQETYVKALALASSQQDKKKLEELLEDLILKDIPKKDLLNILTMAIERGRAYSLELLLKNKVMQNVVSENYDLLIAKAVALENPTLLKSLVQVDAKNKQQVLNDQFDLVFNREAYGKMVFDGYKNLWCSVRTENLEELSETAALLVKNMETPDTQTIYDLFSLAVLCNNEALVDELLKRTDLIDILDQNSNVSLKMAVDLGFISIANKILAAKPAITTSILNELSIIFQARTRFDHVRVSKNWLKIPSIVARLISTLPLSLHDMVYLNPLIIKEISALELDETELLDLMIVMIESNQFELAEELLKKTNIKTQNSAKRSEKKYNLINASIPDELMRTFLKYCLKNNLQDGATLLLYNGATKVMDDEIVEMMLAHPFPAAMDALLIYKLTEAQIKKLFGDAIEKQDWTLFDSLYDQGYQPTAAQAQRALSVAIWQGNFTLVENFLARGINPTEEGSRALYNAVNSPKPNLKIVQMLIECGVDAKERGCQLPLLALENAHRTLDNAAFKEYVNIAEGLLNEFDLDNMELIRDLFVSYRRETIKFDQFKSLIADVVRNSLKKEQQIAFELLQVKDVIKRRDIEYAGDDSVVIKSNRIFEEVVEVKVKEKFNSYPGTESLDKVLSIEKEIRNFILEQILENTGGYTNEKTTNLRNFILKHKRELSEQREPFMSQMRQLCTAKDDNAQIAWRAYDPQASHDPNWPNLLSPQASTHTVHTTAAASKEAMTTKSASETVRTRVAYYFLAMADLDKTNFLQQLADMRRAHEISSGIDSPSCYPGAISRIGKMGAGHPEFQLPPVRKEIIERQMSAMILSAFSKMMDELSVADAEKLLLALINIRPETAEGIIAGKIPYTQEMLILREKFLKNLDNEAQIIKTLNQAFAAEKEKPFSEADKVDINFHLLNLGAGSRAISFQERLQERKEKIKQEQHKLAKEDNKETPASIKVEFDNPIGAHMGMLLIGKSEPPNIQREKQKAYMEKMSRRMQQYVEFEQLYPAFVSIFQRLPSATLLKLTKDIVEGAIDTSPDAELSMDKLISSAKEVLCGWKEKEGSVSEEEIASCLELIRFKSSINGISEQLLQQVKDRMKEQLMMSVEPWEQPSEDQVKLYDNYNKTLLSLLEKLVEKRSIQQEREKKRRLQ